MKINLSGHRKILRFVTVKKPLTFADVKGS
jgi:hypothetical protein